MGVGIAPLLLMLAGLPDGADALVRKTIEAHGAERLRSARIEFSFRGDSYVMAREGGRFRFERIRSTETGYEERVVLDNDGVRLYADARLISTPEEALDARGESVNSVVYFASLPLPLLDPAVRVERLADQTVAGAPYAVLKVNFQKEGGGTDHEDEFRYWIDPRTGRIAYMAYSYARNGGGVRFRVATKRQEVQGILFSDWSNFGLEDQGTPLSELPRRWEAGALPLISEIELEALRVTGPHWP